MEGKSSRGSSSTSHLVSRGAVEVEADGPVLTVVVALPPVLWRMASFKMSSTFLRLLGGGCVQDPGCGAPARATEHKFRA